MFPLQQRRPQSLAEIVRTRGAGANAGSAGLGASAYTGSAAATVGGAGGGLIPHEAAHTVQQRPPAGITDINAAVGHYAR